MLGKEFGFYPEFSRMVLKLVFQDFSKKIIPFLYATHLEGSKLESKKLDDRLLGSPGEKR